MAGLEQDLIGSVVEIVKRFQILKRKTPGHIQKAQGTDLPQTIRARLLSWLVQHSSNLSILPLQ